MPEKHRFGAILAPKWVILRILGESNKDFLILLHDVLIHPIQIISHSTHFRLLIVKYNLPSGFGFDFKKRNSYIILGVQNLFHRYISFGFYCLEIVP
tara:strand:+ start:148 stop:438 length:291 start_codon:yes stop_codon:yes gene_type:complete